MVWRKAVKWAASRAALWGVERGALTAGLWGLLVEK